VVPGSAKTRVDVSIDGLHERLLKVLQGPVRSEYGSSW